MRLIHFAICDDRLIHGQILRRWMKSLNFKKLIVVDDETAEDIIEKRLLALSAPTDIQIQIVSCKEFLQLEEESGVNVFVVLKGLKTVAWLLDKDVRIETLNIGRIPAGVGRVKLEKAMCLNQEDLSILQLLVDKETEVFVQTVPDDEKIWVKERLVVYEKELRI